ncbi:MAG: hypothetical protein RMK99_01750 [Anaerolineales bacterium]|nr:hypothetical protein [Anaerolineales bacterium]
MAFTVGDYHDLIQLLSAHPEWREELRRTLLADDFLALPAIMRELAGAQKCTEARLEQLILAQEKTEEALRLITNRQNKVLGDILEDKYTRRAYSIFWP